MRGWIANTDDRWFNFLAQGQPWVEVNFWRPSDRRAFRGEPGSPFLFRLRAPHNAIAGFGFVSQFTMLPEWWAWDCFGTANGTATQDQFLALVRQHRVGQEATTELREIGCIVLLSPVFFPRELWMPQPKSWGGPIQNNKSYDLNDPEWQELWRGCEERAIQVLRLPAEARAPIDAPARYGRPILITPRLGQGAFRVAVTDAYGRACAVTGEHSLPALEAAHIKPFAVDGPHAVSNGLLLRSDLHRLFDRGYITVDSDMRLIVGDRLKEHFENGRSYYPLKGQTIALPRNAADHPDRDLLRWHQDNRFLG
jgi:putative restriction endonuclease